MRTNEILRYIGIMIVFISIVACQPKNNNQVTASIAMTGSSKAATVAQTKSLMGLLLQQANAFISPGMVDKNGAAINLSQAWVSIKQIEFKTTEVSGAGEVDGAEVEFVGPYYVDMLSSSPVTFDTQAIASADYRRIKMKFHASSSVLPAGVPTELTNNSIFLRGTVGSNNFTFTLDDGTEVHIGGANPILPTDGSKLLIEVNLANIFKQIDMSTVTNNEVISQSARHAGSNLCAEIDPSAGDLYTCIRKGLEKHADFGEDRDGNHDLDTNEDVK